MNNTPQQYDKFFKRLLKDQPLAMPSEGFGEKVTQSFIQEKKHQITKKHRVLVPFRVLFFAIASAFALIFLPNVLAPTQLPSETYPQNQALWEFIQAITTSNLLLPLSLAIWVALVLDVWLSKRVNSKG